MMTTPDELLPVTPDRNSPERKRARLLRRFDEFAEAAAAATPGGWHRTHGVIASIDSHIHDDRKTVDTYRYVVATADVARVNLMGHEPDIARESANARWITLASPRNILSLIDTVREQLENDDLLADANGHYSSVQLEEMKATASHSLPGDVGERERWTLEELLDDIEDEWIDHYLRCGI